MPFSHRLRSLSRTLSILALALAFLLTFASPVLARPAPQAVTSNFPVYSTFTPNDPYYKLGDQWGLNMIDAPKAWDVTLGSPNVTVAVVDTGVWYMQSDILPNMWVNMGNPTCAAGTHGYNFINSSCYPIDSDAASGTYHGTGVSGVIAAVINNGIDIAGVANVRIMALEALGPNGEGSSTNTSLAIQWAADHGARIINLSLGTNTTVIGPNEISNAINSAWSKGALVIAATGNAGTNGLDYPASLPNVVSVGAVDPTGARASFSNYGNGLQIAAPGVQIMTLDGGGNAPHTLTGTSLATPFVSGVAALLLSLNPTLTNVELWNVLNETAVSPTGGYSVYYGHGIVNAWNAIYELNQPFISVNRYPQTVSRGSTFTVGWSILRPANLSASQTLAVTDTHIVYGTNPSSLGNATPAQTGVAGDSYSATGIPMPQGAANGLSFQVVATVNGTTYRSPVYTVGASNLPSFLLVLYQFLSSNLLYLAIFILALAAIVAFVPQRRARARRSAAYRTRTSAPPPYPYAGPPPGPPPGAPGTQPPPTVQARSAQPPPPIEFVRPVAPPAPAPPPTAPPPPAAAAKKRCPNCGTLVNQDNMFCFYCGHPFR